jgi:pimeloyl-ACP methyl ester carboxylesterase
MQPKQSPGDRMRPMNRFIARDGIGLAWEEEGAGLPLLCLPGLTRDGSDFDDLAAALGGRHRLIRLTFRGRGASDRDPEGANYNAGVEARDVVAFLDHLGLDRVVIVGTSRGGLVAMVLAAMAKERLAGVLLNDVGPELAPEGLAAIMSYLGIVPKARTYPEVAAALRARMGAAFPGLADARWEMLARRWFAEADGGIALTYDPRLRDAFAAAVEAPAADLWPLFDALEGVPLAVVRGANSDLLSAETLARMRERRPDLIVAEVPDRGHVPFLDEPEALSALEALLARVER